MKKGFKIVGAMGIALLAGTSQGFADSIPNVDCVDHQHRYLLRDFEPSGLGNLGNLTFIDTVERSNINLFCGFDSSMTNANPIEVACVSSHFGNRGPVVRARVHKQLDGKLSKVALIEVQTDPAKPNSINEMIPLVCF